MYADVEINETPTDSKATVYVEGTNVGGFIIEVYSDGTIDITRTDDDGEEIGHAALDGGNVW